MTGKLSSNYRPDGFHWAARQYCHERGLPPDSLPQVEGALRHRAFMEAIQPIQRAKADVCILAMPTWVFRDGRVECLDDGLTDDMRKFVAEADRLIESIAVQHGLPPRPWEMPPRPREEGRCP